MLDNRGSKLCAGRVLRVFCWKCDSELPQCWTHPCAELYVGRCICNFFQERFFLSSVPY